MATNLLLNPSFETGTDWIKGGTTAAVTFPSTIITGFDGPSEAQVIEVGGNCYLYQDVTVSASTQYTLSAYVQIASWIAGGMFLKATDTSFSAYATATSAQSTIGTWTRISTTFTTGVSVTLVRVVLDTFNGGTFTGYWDAVMLAPGTLTAYDPPYATATASSPTLLMMGV